MGNAIADWLGTAVGDVYGYFGGASDMQATSNAADAQIEALNQQEVAKGLMTQAQADAAAQDIAAGNVSTGTDNVQASINQAAQEGANEGLDAVTAVPGQFLGGVTGILGKVLAAVPIYVWIVAAIVLFFYLGGGTMLESRARKKIASMA